MTTPSKESEALKTLYEAFAANFPTDPNPYKQRAIYDQVHQAGAECPGVTYVEATYPTRAGPRPCLWAYPQNASKSHVLLFMHGGGFSFGSPASHRKLFAHIANQCGVVGISVDYRLAPENPYPAPLDDCVDGYKYLLDQGYEAKKIVVAGDSCGGGLSTSVPLAALRKGWEVPGAAVSLSAWYDMTLGSASMEENKEKDVLSTTEFVAGLARIYTNGGKNVDLRDELVSPVFAESLKGLCPTWFSVCGFDQLRDDGIRVAEKAKGDGVEVVLEVHEGQQHVMEFMVGKAPEADGSVKRIGEWVRKKIGS